MKTRLRGVLVLSLVAALATAAGGSASFREPVSLARLVGTAHSIVTGTVVATGGETFTLAVERRHGGDVGGKVVVAMPARMPTEPRWQPYRRGEELLLFL